MKWYFAIILFCILNFSLVAQDENAGPELIIYIINNIGGSEIEIEMNLISSLCWDAIGNPQYYDVHDLTNEYPGSFQTIFSNGNLGWEACWSYPGYEYGFGLGYYKVTAYQIINGEPEVRDYFYIDYRTSDLPENFNGTTSGDLPVDFNVSNGNFYYRFSQDIFPETTSIWEQKVWIEDIKTELQPLPPDDFSLSSSGGHPYLTWSHSYDTGDYWTGYCIYRSVVSGCGSGAGTFTKIATRTKQTTNYTDYNFTVQGPMTAYYKITAINGVRESDFTETLDICVGLYKENINEIRFDYSLNQNYPNPFNPKTQITFSIKENSFVSLKIYDILGREVAVLKNELFSSGIHTVQFDGSNLVSGIYFYELQANEFRDVKKLILLK